MLANESYLQKRKPTFKNAKTLLVPVTSDKGLCGALNSNIVREVRTCVRDNRAGYKLFLIGEKAYSAMVRPYPDLLT
jgi:F0F1-type ATP synthase gamma subunit